MAKCNHQWVVTQYYKATDPTSGLPGMRASYILCAECGTQRAVNIMAGLVLPIQDKTAEEAKL